MINRFKIFLLIAVTILTGYSATTKSKDFSPVPGVVIAHRPASEKVYLGSPSLCFLPEGNDIVFVSRTAFFDGNNFADNQYNSNFITFHRILNFREEFGNSITIINMTGR